MSDTDESEDENIKLLLKAVDPNLLNDDLFKSKEDENSGSNAIDNQSSSQKPTTNSKTTQKTNNELPKSQRYIELSDEKSDIFKIPVTMQHFFAKKLSKIISEQIEFVDSTITADNQKKKKRKKNVVKLLKGFDTPITLDEDFDSLTFNQNRKKPKIKRRTIEDDNLSELEKCKVAAIESDLIYSGEEIKHWSKRSKAEIFHYKQNKNQKGGLKNCFHYVEPKEQNFENRR